MHRARSDEFIVHLPGDALHPRGRIKLWFMFADFMNHPVPESWPQEPELDGATLAFFHIDWRLAEGRKVEVQITPQTPEPTGFDWHGWVGRSAESADPVGPSRLESHNPYHPP